MTKILSVQNLSKKYDHRDGIVCALDDVSLSIEKGSFVSITGPSGSGKTTLLLTLSGLIRPSSGKILFKEKDLSTASDKELAAFRKENVGFVMQNFSLIPYMTAIQNVMIPLGLNGYSSAQKQALSSAVLELVGLENRLSHYPRELSAGQQQRVAIARALVNKPSVVFADEPTGNLDPSLSSEILAFMQKINKELSITILMVTHSPQAANYGSVKINLVDGKIDSQT
ncbi:MAG TPA: ABC transporter ATP-binding protein [Bacteroidales bacterium]|nr:ABC transporter ATP-binding protein [Paludibacteraceae bacterium]HPT14614.1 ABC transporter ATP-binding protein [Bacteroidales bacterium]